MTENAVKREQCGKGHTLADAYIYKGSPRCRTCKRDNQRRMLQKRREALAKNAMTPDTKPVKGLGEAWKIQKPFGRIVYIHGSDTTIRVDNIEQAEFIVEAINNHDALKQRVKVLEEALGKIAGMELDPKLGQIVGSEHYEAAWLDCVEIAREVIEPNCGNCGDDGEEPSSDCPKCRGTGFAPPAE